jgi:exonuclease VII small subunit
MTDRRKCETMLEEVKAAVDKIYDKYNRKGKENKEEATAVAGCRVGE